MTVLYLPLRGVITLTLFKSMIQILKINYYRLSKMI